MNSNDYLQLATIALAVPGSAIATLDFATRRRANPYVEGALPRDSDVAAWPPPGTPTRPRWQPAASTATEAFAAVSFWRRVLSMSVDVYAVAFLGILIAAVLTAGENLDVDSHPADSVGFLIAAIVLFWLLSRTGRSPGKLLVGARLVRVDDPTRSPTFMRTVARGLIASIASTLFISQLWALGSAERRTLHDRLTSTRVIRTR